MVVSDVNAGSVTVEVPDAAGGRRGGTVRVLQYSAAELGASLSDFLRGRGVPLNTRCGGRGLCESCTVEADGTSIKACLVKLGGGEMSVRVPARSYLRYRPQIVTDYRVNIPCGHDPLYRANGDVTDVPLGVAIDVGTTTVALLLVDLTNGKVLAQGAMFNQQMNLGDDVVTRIQLCGNDKAMIERLQRAVAEETIRPVLLAALKQAKSTPDQVRCFAIAGNTTMQHLIAGEDPTSLGFAPFTPVFLEHREMPAANVFLPGAAHAAGVVHLLPSAAAYVGSDLTAGVVASGLLYDEGPSLLVDVGTNGEIILKVGSKFFGCATAAGPAFEGAGLSCGMRAGDGTIAYVRMDGVGEMFRLQTDVIGGNERPVVGICGSGYIDFIAEGRRAGLIGEAGRFEEDFDSRGRVIPWDCGGVKDKAFRLAFGPGKVPIAVSQRDVASLMQAKAATAAGILTLLARTGVEARDIKTVYLAGGFGTKMSTANAIACGLLPGFVAKQIQAVGNTSLAGAYVALLDRSLLDEMKRVGEQMEVVELNKDPGFEDCYIEQLMLPDPK